MRRRHAASATTVAVIVAGVLAVMATCCSLALAKPKGRAPVTVHLRFRRLHSAGYVWTGRGYAFLGSAPALEATGKLGTLLNEGTGATTTVTQPGCLTTGVSSQRNEAPATNVPIVGPWLTFECGNGQPTRPELYSLASGTWQSVMPASALTGQCVGVLPGNTCYSDVTATAAGSQWLEYVQNGCDPGGFHCSVFTDFQNLSTGALAGDPTGGRTIANLNFPSLSAKVCAPLRVPLGNYQGNYSQAPGSLTFYGRFAVASGINGYALERCGSHQRQTIPSPPAANSHEVLWATGPRRIAGVFLPSRRRFALRAPVKLTDGSELALGNHTLFVLTGNGQLRSARIPTRR